MNRSSIFLYSGIASLLYTVYAGLKYYAITGKGLITSSRAKQMINNGKINHIIDVRTNTEYNMGHYKGAKNIPVTSLNKKTLGKLNKDSDILVYCNTGQRARRGAEIIRNLGFKNVYYIEGSYKNLN
jgi:rhodanese-related sulfurtransferase